MTIEEILNLDCKKEENKMKVNKLLWKVKPVKRILEQNNYTVTQYAPIELLEYCLHGICERYNYELQQIWTYKENNKFSFYHVGIIHVIEIRDWIGNVYGVTMWEIMAKSIIKIYGHILRENNDEKKKK